LTSSLLSTPDRDVKGGGVVPYRGGSPLISPGGSAYTPTVGDRYCKSPRVGADHRCAIVRINSTSGTAEVQFYDKEKNVPKGDVESINISAIQPILYPEDGPRIDQGDPVPKSQLLNTNPETGLSSAEVQERTVQFGPNALEEKKVNKLIELAKKFWGPMPIMICEFVPVLLCKTMTFVRDDVPFLSGSITVQGLPLGWRCCSTPGWTVSCW